jgi:ATP-dependent protease ClpP protease subunit
MSDEPKQACPPDNTETVNEFGIYNMRPMNGIQCLPIIGEIEGHNVLPPQSKATKYEHIIPLLAHIEQDDALRGLLLIMNTVGGDVEAGLAIAEMISGMSKPSVSLVLGGGHSIGVALASSTNYSFITPTATMTVHPIRTSGMIITVSQTYEYYNRMQERILRFVSEHSNISREKLYDLMIAKDEMANDVGTVLIGEDAVRCGIINEIGGLSTALAKLKQLVQS